MALYSQMQAYKDGFGMGMEEDDEVGVLVGVKEGYDDDNKDGTTDGT
jgi:hypothetical protein